MGGVSIYIYIYIYMYEQYHLKTTQAMIPPIRSPSDDKTAILKMPRQLTAIRIVLTVMHVVRIRKVLMIDQSNAS